MTCSQLNCLIELMRLSDRADEVASVRLTKSLGLSKPSIHRLLEGLRGMGLIEKEHYGAARLTDKGDKLARDMLDKAKRLEGTLSNGILSPQAAYMGALTLLTAFEIKDFNCFDDTGDKYEHD